MSNQRTLLIPSGTLDTTIDNVVLIPNDLEPSDASLVVRARAGNTSHPIRGDPNFYRVQPRRYARSLDGSPANVPEPDRYESDFEAPPLASSTFQSYIDDDYYFDMYDTANDRFVGGSSGDLSGSALQAILGGEYNRIQGAGVQEAGGGCGCDDEEPAPAPVNMNRGIRSGYGTSAGTTNTTRSSSRTTGGAMPEPNCSACFPGYGGNPNLCPPTCPVLRGIPFGDPNGTGYSSNAGGGQQGAAANLSSPLIVNQTRLNINRTRNLMDTTTSALQRTRTRNLTQPTGRFFNITGPAVNQVDVNSTCDQNLDQVVNINVDGPAFNPNATYWVPPPPQANRPPPAQRPPPASQIPQYIGMINTQSRAPTAAGASAPAPAPAPGSRLPMPIANRGAPSLWTGRTTGGPRPTVNRQRVNVPRPALNQTRAVNTTRPVLNRTFRASPLGAVGPDPNALRRKQSMNLNIIGGGGGGGGGGAGPSGINITGPTLSSNTCKSNCKSKAKPTASKINVNLSFNIRDTPTCSGNNTTDDSYLDNTQDDCDPC